MTANNFPEISTLFDDESVWVPHPKFVGVAMRTVVTGMRTGGRLSQHLVRVAPGCALEQHVHAEQSELHLVLGGSGLGDVAGQPSHYREGVVSAIPVGTPHSVKAGEEGLLLLATFSPPLAV